MGTGRRGEPDILPPLNFLKNKSKFKKEGNYYL
jgi:hypothetical protein